MTDAPDIAGVSISLACDLAGTTRQVRATWIARRLVEGTKRGTSDKRQVLDLACFAAMVGALGFEDARLTWPQVAHKVRRAPRPSLAVVIDLELKVATATYTHAEVGRAASSGRLTKVVALGPRIAEVAEAYDRVLATLRETVPARTR